MDGLAQQFLEHPRRAWIVWGAAGAVLLALTLPAWESVAAARDSRATLAADLAAAEAAADTLPGLKKRLTALREEDADATAPRGVDESAAEALREEVVQRIAAAGCRYRRLTLDAPVVTEWIDGPPPLPGLVPKGDAGRGNAAAGAEKKEAKFELVTRRLEAEAVGSAEQIAGLLKWAASAHPHATAMKYELEFEEAADASARGVHVTFTLMFTAVRPIKQSAAS